jgi:hypothetical protein
MESRFGELMGYEAKILESFSDDEEAHSLEDEAMVLFIEMAHYLTDEQIDKAQQMFERISEMDFAR